MATLFSHVVEIVMVEEDAVEEQTNRPRKPQHLGIDIGEEPNQKQETSLTHPLILSHKPHLLGHVGSDKSTHQSSCHRPSDHPEEV